MDYKKKELPRKYYETGQYLGIYVVSEATGWAELATGWAELAHIRRLVWLDSHLKKEGEM